jgi:hypothetical protein
MPKIATERSIVYENNMDKAYKIGYNLDKKGPILILFGLFRIYIQNATSLLQKTVQMSVRWTING